MTSANFMDRLGQSWDRRQDTYRDGKEPITLQSSVEISKPAQEVWDFISSPHSSVLLNHHHVRSFPVPGTPEGVGQQTCSMDREANGRISVTVSEIVEYEPPSRLVSKTLTGPSEALALMVISPTTTGCTYTTSVGMRIAYGTSRKIAPVAQRALDELAAKVCSFVEAGVRLETVDEGGNQEGEVGEQESTPNEDGPS